MDDHKIAEQLARFESNIRRDENQKTKSKIQGIREEVIDIFETHNEEYLYTEYNCFAFYDESKGIWKIDYEDKILQMKVNIILIKLAVMNYLSARQIIEISKKLKLKQIGTGIPIGDFNRFTVISHINKKKCVEINTDSGVVQVFLTDSSIIYTNYNKDNKYTSSIGVSRLQKNEKSVYFFKKLEEMIPDATDRDTFFNFLGYSLVPNFDWETCLLLFGNGRNGKSTLVASWASIFENAKPKDMGKLNDTFGKASIHDADLIWAKIESLEDKKPDMSIIKATTSGEMQEINIKNKPNFTKTIQAKMIITANYLPVLRNTSDFRRFEIINMPNKVEIPEPEFKEYMLSNEAVFILFTEAISRIPYIFKNMSQLIVKTEDQSRIYFDELYDPFYNFCNQFLNYDKKTSNFKFTSSQKITNAYNQYAKQNKHDILKVNFVSTRVSKIFNTQSIQKDRVRGFEGLVIEIKSIEEEEKDRAKKMRRIKKENKKRQNILDQFVNKYDIFNKNKK